MFANVDFEQVKVLTRFALRSEWRTNSDRLAKGRRRSSPWWFVFSILSYLLIGAFLGAAYANNHEADTLVVATALVSLYIMLVTASNIFLAFGTGFLSPNETELIAPFPVSSETFYISRICILMVYSLTTSTALAIGPTVAVAIFERSVMLTAIPGMLVVSALSAFFSAMLVVTIYALVIKRVAHKRLTSFFNYVQLFGSMFTIASFVLLPRLLDHLHLDAFTLSVKPELAFFPAYWYASIEAIATQQFSAQYLCLALAAIAGLLVLTVSSYRILANTYRASIEEFAVANVEDTKRTIRKRSGKTSRSIVLSLLRTPESRAVWILFRAQFRFDPKFRLSIFSWLPVTALYFVLAVTQGAIHDPFAGFSAEIMQANMLYLIALLSPMLIMQQMSQTESYKASWILFVSPINRAGLLLGVRNIVVSLIFVPFMLLLAIAFMFYMPASSAILHTLMISAMAQLIFEAFLMIAPKMPFSEQRKQQRNTVGRTLLIALAMIGPVLLMGVVMYFGYRDMLRYWSFLILILTIAILAHRVVKSRLTKKLELQEYAG
jgi:ABC-2 type transport system permease protein